MEPRQKSSAQFKARGLVVNPFATGTSTTLIQSSNCVREIVARVMVSEASRTSTISSNDLE